MFLPLSPLGWRGIVVARVVGWVVGSVWNLVNEIILCRLPVSCCNFIFVYYMNVRRAENELIKKRNTGNSGNLAVREITAYKGQI